MSREIKFRYWEKTGKLMYYSDDYSDLEEFWSYAKHKWAIPMYFTGLKDKNGKEIYEGDIVYSQVNEEGNCKVIFKNGAFRYIGKEKTFYGFGEKNIYLEVIGNIMENPELLKNG